MYQRFGLTLMVTHACNLRCAYCYTGEKLNRAMPVEIGRRAIERAIASIEPGGALDLGFFGGEPLIEATRIQSLIEFAHTCAAARRITVTVNITTNGTRDGDPAAWAVMLRDDVDLVISHDGLPSVHDKHRLEAGGGATSAHVEKTIRRLLENGKLFRVNMVVRPDTVSDLAEGIAYLRSLGVTHTDLSLDLWCNWPPEAIAELEQSLERCGRLWRDGLPNCGINWFDLRAIEIAGIAVEPTARCGFGDGEIAVSPAGGLYPCERLIQEDRPEQPSRLPGHVMAGEDFLCFAPPCAVKNCGLNCRCSNLVRTADAARSDALLERWDLACKRETARWISFHADESQTVEVSS